MYFYFTFATLELTRIDILHVEGNTVTTNLGKMLASTIVSSPGNSADLEEKAHWKMFKEALNTMQLMREAEHAMENYLRHNVLPLVQADLEEMKEEAKK